MCDHIAPIAEIGESVGGFKLRACTKCGAVFCEEVAD